VRFENVDFTYDGAVAPALRQVTFTAEAGRTTAIVGPSGAGKSTLLALLLRHHDPDGGRVLLGGRCATAFPLDALRRGIAVVSQETYLFHATVAENLRLARPDATDEELTRAARAAGVHDEITALPEGYATVLGERGATLSGGQRQRLALARGLLADAPVLVLDEATSAVDERREADIVRDLPGAAGGRTVLVVAHRLAAVRHADRIVVLDGGRVDAIGDHTALVDAGGVYTHLVEAGHAHREGLAA
jgi:ABC-type multidrug transport system fused ATPase/permease subunit